jgi:two-component system, sensor histidine kinase PdtaS
MVTICKTILLVEDELIIAMNETKILEKYGYSVVTARTAEESVQTAARGGVDLILMDIDLGAGRMDGTRAAQEILKNREIPIVFLTSHAEKEMVDRVKGITRYGYVLKNSGEFVLAEAIIMAFELFEAHNNLKMKEIEAREIVDNLDCAVIKYAEDDRIFFFNKGAEKIFGYTADEVCGTTGVGLINPPVDSTGVDHQKMLRNIFIDTDTYSYNENENMCKDGSKVWMAWRNKAVFDNNGKKLYVQSIGNDITELRSTIQKFEKSFGGSAVSKNSGINR